MELQPLNIVIIGAGIGGLSCALGLRKNGHHVRVYEQSRSGDETGAAVVLGPNAHGIIKRLGIDAQKGGAVTRDWHSEYTASGDLISRTNLVQTANLWKHSMVLCLQISIHNALREALLSLETTGPVAKLHFSSRVVDVIPQSATVLFEDGSSTVADMIIGADGIKALESMTRARVHDSKPFPSGKSAYRFLVNRQTAIEKETLGDIIMRTGEFSIWRIWMYTTHYNNLLNCVCVHPDALSDVKESENAFGDSDDKRDHKNRMMEIFRDFDPRVLGLLELAEPSSVRLWQLFDMDPPLTRCTGKLGLVGDAALPFLPYIGQGAACALEDAASLSALFPLGTTPQEVPSRLELYERARKGRAEEIHTFSRRLGRDLEPGNEDASVNRSLATKKYIPYIFGHDEYEHSVHELQEFLSHRNESDDPDHSRSLEKSRRQKY